MGLYVVKYVRDTTSPHTDILASFASNTCLSVVTVLWKANRIKIQQSELGVI